MEIRDSVITMWVMQALMLLAIIAFAVTEPGTKLRMVMTVAMVVYVLQAFIASVVALFK